jgi:2-hydroxychromene-2-carboxylate isomerase
MMSKTIQYYFAPHSPFAYMGHERFAAIARRHGAAIEVRPINLGTVFPLSGGLPLSKRAPQRQAYRLVELKRWSAFLGMAMNIEPRFFPVNGDAAARLIIAVLQSAGTSAAMAISGRIARGVWVDQLDIAARDTLHALASAEGLPADALLAAAEASEAHAMYEQFTQEAIDRQVFGAPTYVYRDELYWGQDRLEFLDRALAG